MAKTTNNEAIEACKAMAWDEVSISTKRISKAIKTSQGIPFAVTEEYALVFMSDSDSIYTAPELSGLFKKYGNHSDFEDSHVITSILSNDLDKTPAESMREDIVNTPQRFANLPSVITDTLNATDWNAVADELLPYLTAMQDIFTIKEIKMF